MISKSFSMAVMLTALYSVVEGAAEATPNTRQRSRSPRASSHRTKKHKPTRSGSTPRVGGGLIPLPRAIPDNFPMSMANYLQPAMTRGGLRLPARPTVSNETQTSEALRRTLSGTDAAVGAEGAGPSRVHVPIPDIPHTCATSYLHSPDSWYSSIWR